MTTQKLTHYFDYKSPYAYLAQEETFRLQEDCDVDIEWLPCPPGPGSLLATCPAELPQAGEPWSVPSGPSR